MNSSDQAQKRACPFQKLGFLDRGACNRQRSTDTAIVAKQSNVNKKSRCSVPSMRT